MTYVFSFTGPSSLETLFAREGLKPRVALTARDSDVIKTYVRLGMGVGIVASVAHDPEEDADLVMVDASHLFPIHTTWVGFRRGTLLRNFAYDFLQLFGSHLTRRLVDTAIEARDTESKAALFAGITAAYSMSGDAARRAHPETAGVVGPRLPARHRGVAAGGAGARQRPGGRAG